VTRLRKMMLEELQRRHYSRSLLEVPEVVSDFAKHFGKSPDKLGPNELRSYQAYLLKGATDTRHRGELCSGVAILFRQDA